MLGNAPWARVSHSCQSLLFDPLVPVLSTDPTGFERGGLSLEHETCSCTAEAVEKVLRGFYNAGSGLSWHAGSRRRAVHTKVLDIKDFRCCVPDEAARRLAASPLYGGQPLPESNNIYVDAQRGKLHADVDFYVQHMDLVGCLLSHASRVFGRALVPRAESVQLPAGSQAAAQGGAAVSHQLRT